MGPLSSSSPLGPLSPQSQQQQEVYDESKDESFIPWAAIKPSILQDLELGRPMEIDALFGLPLKLAGLTGARVPNLSLLVALVKQAARGEGLYPPIG